MKFSLSTNWCNRTVEDGEVIAEMALELGFDRLELGFHTTQDQVRGFKTCLDRMPVGSVHAFCPVPISAPQGYPELYALASFDEETRKMAHFQVVKNIRFAAEMGADALVLHLGRVPFRGWISAWDARRRRQRGRRMGDIAKRELDALVPELEANGVTLGLENLPSEDGFPAQDEYAALCGDWVRPWLDTGHAHVVPFACENPVGLHLNDSVGGDDHLAPGTGQVDFAALASVAAQARHLVFEPNPSVTAEELRSGLDFLKGLWKEQT